MAQHRKKEYAEYADLIKLHWSHFTWNQLKPDILKDGSREAFSSIMCNKPILSFNCLINLQIKLIKKDNIKNVFM